MEEKSKKEFTNVTFRVPAEDYIKYKMVLLKEQKEGRKTPTSDLNFHIRTVIQNAEDEERK